MHLQSEAPDQIFTAPKFTTSLAGLMALNRATHSHCKNLRRKDLDNEPEYAISVQELNTA